VQPAEADSSAPVLQQPVQPDYIAVTRSGFVDLSESEFLATLSYFDENSTSESVLDKWIRITSDTVVPIDAKIRLTVNFKDLDIKTLNASGGKAFYTVPDPLRNNIADGALKDLTDKQIATATRGENNQVVFTFDMNWVQEMISGNTTKLSGSFNIDVEIDPKKVGEDSSFTMTLNRENFQLQFEKEWREKRSNLELEKSEPVVKEVVKTVNEEEEEHENDSLIRNESHHLITAPVANGNDNEDDDENTNYSNIICDEMVENCEPRESNNMMLNSTCFFNKTSLPYQRTVLYDNGNNNNNPFLSRKIPFRNNNMKNKQLRMEKSIETAQCCSSDCALSCI
jgi:hypothetical protein